MALAASVSQVSGASLASFYTPLFPTSYLLLIFRLLLHCGQFYDVSHLVLGKALELFPHPIPSSVDQEDPRPSRRQEL